MHSGPASRNGRKHRVLGALLALAVAIGTGSAALAQTEPPDLSAGTTANAGGDGVTTPIIECTWALNDVNHDWTDFQQYGNDDDHPDGPDAPTGVTDNTPCAADGARAKQADGWTDLIAVLPNASDLPTQAYVELWAAVDSNNTAGTIVRWDVYHPDGSPKVQVDGTRYSTSTELCTGPTGMFAAAIANGIISTTARNNIQRECETQHKNLWYGAFPISKHQPWGSYTVTLTASLSGGGSVTRTFSIDVISFYQLEKDFEAPDFGSIQSNNHYWQTVQGDFDFGTGGPTVRNTGNAGIGLDVSFDPLCKQGVPFCSDVKRIDKFDAHFGARAPENLQYLGTAGPFDSTPDINQALLGNTNPTGTVVENGPDNQPPNWYSFDNELARTLCPNDTGKFEASIYVELIENGTYAGELFLRGRRNPVCPTDLGAPYNAPPSVPVNGYWAPL
jgi:hypothetical protein